MWSLRRRGSIRPTLLSSRMEFSRRYSRKKIANNFPSLRKPHGPLTSDNKSISTRLKITFLNQQNNVNLCLNIPLACLHKICDVQVCKVNNPGGWILGEVFNNSHIQLASSQRNALNVFRIFFKDHNAWNVLLQHLLLYLGIWFEALRVYVNLRSTTRTRMSWQTVLPLGSKNFGSSHQPLSPSLCWQYMPCYTIMAPWKSREN